MIYMNDCPKGMEPHKEKGTGREMCKSKDKGFFYFPDVELVMWGYETPSEELTNLTTIDKEGYTHNYRIVNTFYKDRLKELYEDVLKIET